MHISHKAFNIARGAGVAAVLAFTGWAIHAPVWLAVAVTAGVAVGTVAIASRVVHRADMFAELPLESRTSIIRWIGVASVVHVAWVAGVEIRPDLAAWWSGGLIAVAGLEYYTAVGLEYLMTRPVHPDLVQARAARIEARQAAEADNPTVGLSAALDRSRLSWLTVISHERIGTVGWQFTVQIPSQTGDSKSATAPTLNAGHAESIAIAMAEVTGIALMSNWVQVRKTPYAGRYTISVVTEDVRAEVIPYVDDPTPTSITVPCPIGVQIDGTVTGERLDQHGQTIGKSRWGKTSLVHRKGAWITRCPDATWWICGTEKLYDLVAGWLQPYEGTDRRPPIDYIMYGLGDVLEILVGAMRLARYRQRVPLSKRRRWRKVIITLDEASFPLRNTAQKVMYDGKMRTAAELVAMLHQGAGSGEVYVHLVSQRGTNDQFGDQGGDTKANSGFVEVFATQDPDELGRAFGDWQLAKPRHKGEFWANVGDGEPVNLKAAYIQEVDPAREKLHDGATIADVSWARRDLVVDEPLDRDEAEAVGEAYINRRRTADELVEYLTGAAPEVENTAMNEGYETAMAELAALGLLPNRPAPEATLAMASEGTARTATAVMAPPATRKDRIVRLVGANGQMTTAQIFDALREEEGGEINETSVFNTLRELVADKKLRKEQKGHYIAA